VKGSYYGYFDHVGGLFRACRDIYKEASHVLYSQNTLEFDHPLSLITFSREVSQSLLQSIRSMNFEMQLYLYVYRSKSLGPYTSLHPDQWRQMWDVVSAMEGLEEIRVKFGLPVDGWLGWTEEEVLEPLCMVRRPLKVFEVQMLKSDGKTSSDGDGREREVPFKLIRY